jgi:hypothetical protein
MTVNKLGHVDDTPKNSSVRADVASLITYSRGVFVMQHRYFLSSLTTFLIMFTIAPPATAALTSVLGGLGVYDSDQDITWLANANAGAGSSFDDGSNTIDGRMKWASANAWAASLNIGGFTNWRLPEMDINGDGTVVDCAVVTYTNRVSG